MGSTIVGFPNHSVAAHQKAMAGIGERHIQRIRLGFQIDRLPRAGACDRNTSGNTAAKADAEHECEDKIDGG